MGPCRSDGVRYASLERFAIFATSSQVDLLIVSREIPLLGAPHRARKAVLWMHDLATAFPDPNRTVASRVEFRRDLDGERIPPPAGARRHRLPTHPHPCRAQRHRPVRGHAVGTTRPSSSAVCRPFPERGLEALVKPGGIMERLPEYRLTVTMYENYPPQMMPLLRAAVGVVRGAAQRRARRRLDSTGTSAADGALLRLRVPDSVRRGQLYSGS